MPWRLLTSLTSFPWRVAQHGSITLYTLSSSVVVQAYLLFIAAYGTLAHAWRSEKGAPLYSHAS